RPGRTLIVLPLGSTRLPRTGRRRAGNGPRARGFLRPERDSRRRALSLVELEVGPLAVAGRRRDPEGGDAPHQGIPVANDRVVIAPSVLDRVFDLDQGFVEPLEVLAGLQLGIGLGQREEAADGRREVLLAGAALG